MSSIPSDQSNPSAFEETTLRMSAFGSAGGAVGALAGIIIPAALVVGATSASAPLIGMAAGAALGIFVGTQKIKIR